MKSKQEAKRVLKRIQKNVRHFSVKKVYKIQHIERIGWEIAIKLKSTIVSRTMMECIFENIKPSGYVHIAEDGKLEICIS